MLLIKKRASSFPLIVKVWTLLKCVRKARNSSISPYHSHCSDFYELEQGIVGASFFVRIPKGGRGSSKDMRVF